MMGHQSGCRTVCFIRSSLEDHVPANHLLRGIDRFLDLTDLRAYLAPFYSHTGRPSIDPELMIRMLIVGYCFGIRSERRLCEEVHLNLAYRWFCRLGLEDTVPEHSTFSKNRHGRFRESDTFGHVFETVLQRCMNEGLVAGEGFAIDASVGKADAARARGIPGAILDDRAFGPAQASRTVREYLEGIDAEGRPETMRKSISLTDPAAEVALYLHPARMDLVSLLHEVCQLQREIAPLARIELHIEPQTLLMVADAKLLFSSLQQPAFLVSPLRFEVFNG